MAQKLVKSKTDNISTSLAHALRSGKYSLGFKTARKALINKTSRLVIYSRNLDEVRKARLVSFAKVIGCPVFEYPGSNIQLGAACGKKWTVSCATIVDAGDSDILERMSA